MKDGTKHTPGKWVQVHKIIDADNGRHGSGIMERICIMDDGPTEQEREANARLIALAPEFYDAMRDLFEQCAMVHKCWGDNDNTQRAATAIKRAQSLLAQVEGRE